MREKDYFLFQAAERILSETQNQLHNTIIILPTKRSCLFLEKYLGELHPQKSFIAPVMVTIEQWIRQISGYEIPDSTTLSCYAYKAYRSYLETIPSTIQEETFNDPILVFDRSQKLLNDYNEMDLHLVDIDALFANILHWNTYHSLSFLSEEQKDAIISFWGKLPERLTAEELCFSDTDPTAPQKYISVIESAIDIYNRLTEMWEKDLCGSQGWVYRKTTQVDADEIIRRTMSSYGLSSIDHFFCVGLYNLTPVEQAIFKKTSGYLDHFQAYWEEVILPLRGTLNGILEQPSIERNRQLLGGEKIHTSKEYPQVELLRANSTIIQERLVEDIVSKILQEDSRAIEDTTIAVVLSDEQTLIPLLDMASSQFYPVNITMGYPLKNTSIAIWIKRYMEIRNSIQKTNPNNPSEDRFPNEKLKRWLQAPLSQEILGELYPTLLKNLGNFFFEISRKDLETLFASSSSLPLGIDDLFPTFSSGDAFIRQIHKLIEVIESINRRKIENLSEDHEKAAPYVLENEYLYRYKNVLYKLQNTLGELSDFNNEKILSLLLNGLVETDSIPFEGEPLKGLQLMGFLETRSLSFDYVIILDVKEGQLPKTVRHNSLIPYTLRLAYGLPSIKTRDEINAYHFYRLIAESKRVFLLRDVRERNLGGNTPSRYLKQIELLSPIQYAEKEVSMPLPFIKEREIVINPTDKPLDEFRGQLLDIRDEQTPKINLSASDLKKYLRCPLSFYWNKVCGIREPKQKTELLGSDEAGNIVHATLEELLRPWAKKGIPLDKEEIDPKHIEKKLREAYCIERWGTPKKNLRPMDLLNIRNLKKMVQAALKNDYALVQKGYSIFYESFEKEIKTLLPTPKGHLLPFKGFLDRIDRIVSPNGKEEWRIIDYKTGYIKTLDLPHEDFGKILEINPDNISLLEIASQLALYGYAFLYTDPTKSSVTPAIYALNSKNEKESLLYLRNLDKNEIIRFERKTKDLREITAASPDHPLFIIRQILSVFDRIVDESIPIRQTPSPKHCLFCPYKEICGRVD